MNSRERLLALGVGAIVLALVAWFGVSSVIGWFDAKDRRIESLAKDLKKKKEEDLKGRLALKRLEEYQARSLPPEVDLANSAYHAWLIKITQQTGLSDVQVITQRPLVVKNTFRRLSFTLKAKGELAQLVEFLHQFEKMDWMHRIDVMGVTPQNDSKKLTLDFTITALSLNAAAKADKLSERISPQWQARTLADYREPILNRNFFGAPNNAPQIDASTRSTAYLNRSFELPIKASDPDPLDRITYVLAKNVDPPARLDERTGKLTWTPKAKGDYSFEILVRDDGLPSMSKSKTIQVSVTDPPPPPQVAKAPDPPKKVVFDPAKYTVLTSVIAVNEDAEIWLHDRPNNEIHKLRLHDRFAIGTVKGEVAEIGVDDAVLLVDGKLRRIVQDQILLNAVNPTE